MAFIDYGAIAFIDGKCVQTGFFMDMKKSVGWEKEGLSGNYFSYLGDKDLTFAFYKEQLFVVCNDEDYNIHEYFNCSNYKGWKKYSNYAITKGEELVEYTVKNKGHSVYKFEAEYKWHKYSCVFGYGIDYPFYKKTKRFNYYRSPEYLIHEFFYKTKEFFYWKIYQKILDIVRRR